MPKNAQKRARLIKRRQRKEAKRRAEMKRRRHGQKTMPKRERSSVSLGYMRALGRILEARGERQIRVDRRHRRQKIA